MCVCNLPARSVVGLEDELRPHPEPPVRPGVREDLDLAEPAALVAVDVLLVGRGRGAAEQRAGRRQRRRDVRRAGGALERPLAFGLDLQLDRRLVADFFLRHAWYGGMHDEKIEKLESTGE